MFYFKNNKLIFHVNGEREYKRIYEKQYLKDNLEKIKERRKVYYKNNHEKIQKSHKRWVKNNIDYVKRYMKQYCKHKRKTDLKYNLNCKISTAIRETLKGNKKNRKWKTFVNYNSTDLIKHLKSTIPIDYSWEDFLNGNLHIDHIIPIRAFNFTKPEHPEFKDCWNLYNLRLLPAKKNRIKHDTMDNPFLLGLLIKNST